MHAYRGRFGDDPAVVLEDWNFAGGIEGQEFRLAVLAALEIHFDEFVRCTDFLERPQCAKGAAIPVAVELHRPLDGLGYGVKLARDLQKRLRAQARQLKLHGLGDVRIVFAD